MIKYYEKYAYLSNLIKQNGEVIKNIYKTIYEIVNDQPKHFLSLKKKYNRGHIISGYYNNYLLGGKVTEGIITALKVEDGVLQCNIDGAYNDSFYEWFSLNPEENDECLAKEMLLNISSYIQEFL